MSVRLDSKVAEEGTRFRIFPQPRYLAGFQDPEAVYVSVPLGQVSAGPSDDRIYVIDAINKTAYGPGYLPPHTGQRHPGVRPNAGGHFDHLDIDSRDFKSAQMYATVRRVLDIWEDYFERRIEWAFSLHYSRIELVPLIRWDNAHSGYGFLEFGFGRTPFGAIDTNRPYCMNFDVLAHELGHSIINSEVGYPSSVRTHEYGGHHEAAGDLVALIASLHFDIVVNKLLTNSHGNLFTVNELTRVGELSDTRQIRLAFNWERMSTVGNEGHDLSKPLTGAVFDVLVEVFQKNLVAGDVISQDLADRSYHGPEDDIDDDRIQEEFDAAFQGREKDFKIALLEARDYAGTLLARTWDRLEADHFSYVGFGSALLASDREITVGAHQDTIRDCFAWREIGLPPDSHALRSFRISDCQP